MSDYVEKQPGNYNITRLLWQEDFADDPIPPAVPRSQHPPQQSDPLPYLPYPLPNSPTPSP